jgi:hypothetical protein
MKHLICVVLLAILGIISVLLYFRISENHSGLPSAQYKPGPFDGQVPEEWSMYYGIGNPANNLNDLLTQSSLFYSISPHEIDFGDGAFEQVDFYLLTPSAEQELLSSSSQSKFLITTETENGVPAKIIHYPTDKGGISVEATGGEDYIMGNGNSPAGHSEYLLVRDWSLGDKEFNDAFRHFLQTATFTFNW